MVDGYEWFLGGANIDNISDKRTEEHYLKSNPYENYGKKVLAECDFCETELIEGDEIFVLNGWVYCSKECAISDIQFERITLTREWYESVGGYGD